MPNLWWEATINIVLISRRSVSFCCFFFFSSCARLQFYCPNISFATEASEAAEKRQRQKLSHPIMLHIFCRSARGNNYACKRFSLASLPTSAIFNLLWVHTSYSLECHFSYAGSTCIKMKCFYVYLSGSFSYSSKSSVDPMLACLFWYIFFFVSITLTRF